MSDEQQRAMTEVRETHKMKIYDNALGKPATQIIDGQEVGYEVTLDERDLARMVQKANRNHSWRSQDGPLTVKILYRKPVEAPENGTR